jgi:hypothetical protein
MRAIYPVFRALLANQVIRADDLARAMVDVVVRRTGEHESSVFENRDIRAMVESLRRSFVKRYDQQCVELDALPPSRESRDPEHHRDREQMADVESRVKLATKRACHPDYLNS